MRSTFFLLEFSCPATWVEAAKEVGEAVGVVVGVVVVAAVVLERLGSERRRKKGRTTTLFSS
jgi:hypothetical protein